MKYFSRDILFSNLFLLSFSFFLYFDKIFLYKFFNGIYS